MTKRKTQVIQNISLRMSKHPPFEPLVEFLLHDGRHVLAKEYMAEVGLAALTKQVEEHRLAVEKKRREPFVRDLVIGQGLSAAARKQQLRSAWKHVETSVYPPCFCGHDQRMSDDSKYLTCASKKPCAFRDDERFRRAVPRCSNCSSKLVQHPDYDTRLQSE